MSILDKLNSSQDWLHQLISTKLQYALESDIKQTRIEYSRGFDYYSKRVNAIKFTGFSHILDAACGWGQWTIVLSEKNNFVSAIDLNAGGIEIANKAAEIFEKKNIQFYQGDLHFLPYKNETFDAVFCYGALMYTREDSVVRELSRVLKPNGKLYICSNGPAWPFYKILMFGLRQRKVRAILSGLKMLLITLFCNILRGRYSHKLTFIRKRDIEQLFALNNLTVHYYGPEGSYGNQNNKEFEPLFEKTYFGLPADFEVLGKKDGRSKS